MDEKDLLPAGRVLKVAGSWDIPKAVADTIKTTDFDAIKPNSRQQVCVGLPADTLK
jgi:hypothetical protein